MPKVLSGFEEPVDDTLDVLDAFFDSDCVSFFLLVFGPSFFQLFPFRLFGKGKPGRSQHLSLASWRHKDERMWRM